MASALAPTKFYKSPNQFLSTDNVPPLEAGSSLLHLSNKGRASVPLKNLEAWEKKARKLIAINSHADLFSSHAFLCLRQQSMSVTALSTLLEAVAKSVKHTTAMSTILTTKIFQARRDAALASSKLLLDNSSYDLRNAPINSKTLFVGRIKEVAKTNYEAQQQRFLASTSAQSQSRNQKPQTRHEFLKYSAKQTRPKPTKTYRPKTETQSFSSSNKRIILRGLVTFDSSAPPNLPLPPQSYESQPFPLPALPRPDIPVGGRLAHFLEQWEEFTDNKWVLSIVRHGFRIPFTNIPP